MSARAKSIKSHSLRRGQRFGKYVLRKKLGQGAFSAVWRAEDTVEGVAVALKIPRADLLTPDMLREFQEEARVVATLDHPNILKIKNADYVDGQFFIAYDVGKKSLFQDMRRVLPLKRALHIVHEVLKALAYAHSKGVVHRDLKPENIILFDHDQVRLADFGISKLATKTIMTENPMGTLGYMAPEQAYGKARYSSDTFSVGILLYELLTGHLPDWPFEWPFKQHERLLRRGGPLITNWVRKATSFKQRGRYQDATEMLQDLQRIERRLGKLEHQRKSKRLQRRKKPLLAKTADADRSQSFSKKFGKLLELDFLCSRCKRPIAESMICCPWCGYDKNDFSRYSRFPYTCGDCNRGVHGDWAFCPWCYTDKFTLVEEKPSKDRRYTGRCANPRCGGKLMPFMHYCPWCHRKRRKPWRLARLSQGCPRCHWSVSRSHWNYCPWCGHWPLV